MNFKQIIKFKLKLLKDKTANTTANTTATANNSPSASPSASPGASPSASKTEDTLDQLTKSIVENFFEDNQTRYQESEQEFTGIVPVLSIKVPEDIKHLIFSDDGTAKSSGIKRSFDSVQSVLDSQGSSIGSKKLKSIASHTDELIAENAHSSPGTKRSFYLVENASGSEGSSVVTKKIKTIVSHRDELFVKDAPPIKFDANGERISYEKEQEMRVKLAMLQTPKSLNQDQLNDPMLAAEYANEIFGNLFDAEPHMLANPTYAGSQQHTVSWKIRGVLVDWVLEAHYVFGLLPETLLLAVISLIASCLFVLQLLGNFNYLESLHCLWLLNLKKPSVLPCRILYLRLIMLLPARNLSRLSYLF